MSAMSVSEARSHLPELIARSQAEPVVLEKRGEPVAVLVSTTEYARLTEAREEMEDIAAFDAAVAEEGPNIPWEQVKTDLGWQ